MLSALSCVSQASPCLQRIQHPQQNSCRTALGMDQLSCVRQDSPAYCMFGILSMNPRLIFAGQPGACVSCPMPLKLALPNA